MKKEAPAKELPLSDFDDVVRVSEGYRLTTARIYYRLPDHKRILQVFIWQNLDLPPRFPELQKFLSFWERKIEGPLHSVEVACAGPERFTRGFRAIDSSAIFH